MKIQDSLGLVTPESVTQVASAVGVVPPVEVRQLGKPRRQARYGLRFADHAGVPPQVLAVDMVPTSRGYPLYHQWAALSALRFTEEIPSLQDFSVLPAQIFGVPSSISPYADEVDGRRWVELDAASYPRVAGDLGRTLVALWDVPLKGFGIRAEAGRFVPLARTWREEWETHVRSLERGALASGTDLGWLSAALGAAIDERLAALEGLTPVLVHGSLTLDSLRYAAGTEEPELVRLTGWDLALAGDGLVDVAYLLTNAPDALGPVFAGIGTDRVREWLEPGAIQRLEAYVYTSILQRVRSVADHVLSLRDTSTVSSLSGIVQAAQRALEPGFVATQIEQGLAHATGSGLPVVGTPTPPHHFLARQALDVFRVDPPMDAANAPLGLAILGAASLAEVSPEHGPLLQQSVDHLSAAYSRFGLATLGLPIADRPAWLAGLVDEVVAATNKGPLPCTSLLLTWAAVRVLDSIDWTVSDRLLRHFEATVRACMADEAVSRSGAAIDPKLGLTHCLVGLAAVTELPLRVEGTSANFAALQAELEEQAADQLERVDPSAMPIPRTLDPAGLIDLAMNGLVGTQMLTRPVVALALHVAAGNAQFPADAATLIQHCGQ